MSSADFFQNQLFLKNSFGNTIRVSNSLDPNQAGCFFGPDLGPNCLQRLSADDTSSNESTVPLRFTLYILGNLAIFFLLYIDLFSKITFSKTSFRNNIKLPRILDPDKACHFDRPDLHPNSLKSSSADDKSLH